MGIEIGGVVQRFATDETARAFIEPFYEIGSQGVKSAHDEAMSLCDCGDSLKRRDPETARAYYRLACRWDTSAARVLRQQADPQHVWWTAILYRSAASLALMAGDYDEVDRLVTEGAAGQPEIEIVESMRRVGEQAARWRANGWMSDPEECV